MSDLGLLFILLQLAVRERAQLVLEIIEVWRSCSNRSIDRVSEPARDFREGQDLHPHDHAKLSPQWKPGIDTDKAHSPVWSHSSAGRSPGPLDAAIML